MKKWNGLLHKEWVVLRVPFLVTVSLLLFANFFIPYIFASDEWTTIEITTFGSFLLSGMVTFVPVCILFYMLHRDMKQPDLWFHTTATVYQLMGVKLWISFILGSSILLIPVFVMIVQYFLHPTYFQFDALLFIGTIWIVMVLVSTISTLLVGCFFLVLYQYLKKYIKSFSMIVTFFLFILTMFLNHFLTQTVFYQEKMRVWPIDLMKIKNPMLDVEWNERLFLFDATSKIYVSEILMSVFIVIVLFFASVRLLEKSVMK